MSKYKIATIPLCPECETELSEGESEEWCCPNCRNYTSRPLYGYVAPNPSVDVKRLQRELTKKIYQAEAQYRNLAEHCKTERAELEGLREALRTDPDNRDELPFSPAKFALLAKERDKLKRSLDYMIGDRDVAAQELAEAESLAQTRKTERDALMRRVASLEQGIILMSGVVPNDCPDREKVGERIQAVADPPTEHPVAPAPVEPRVAALEKRVDAHNVHLDELLRAVLGRHCNPGILSCADGCARMAVGRCPGLDECDFPDKDEWWRLKDKPVDPIPGKG